MADPQIPMSIEELEVMAGSIRTDIIKMITTAEIGKAVTIRDGTDATVIAIRDMVSQALVAAQRLANKGLSVRVIDCHTLKPFDIETIGQAVEETGAIATAENNMIHGGLGSVVAEVLVENSPVPMRVIGVRDTFAESGPHHELIEKYGMSADHIADAVEEVFAREDQLQ